MSDVAGELEAVLRARPRGGLPRAPDVPRTRSRSLAVSKLQPLEALREAYAAGVRAFGENYAQELRDKSAALADLAGHPLARHRSRCRPTRPSTSPASAHVFHALDRVEVAEELSRRRTGTPLDVYLEVNVGGESTKGGVAPASARRAGRAGPAPAGPASWWG